MKRIVIYYENSHPLFIRDDDKDDLDTYIKKILPIFNSNKIALFKTSEGNYIIKPSKIFSIEIGEESVKKEDVITDK
jgi:hypothetical protein